VSACHQLMGRTPWRTPHYHYHHHHPTVIFFNMNHMIVNCRSIHLHQLALRGTTDATDPGAELVTPHRTAGATLRAPGQHVQPIQVHSLQAQPGNAGSTHVPELSPSHLDFTQELQTFFHLQPQQETGKGGSTAGGITGSTLPRSTGALSAAAAQRTTAQPANTQLPTPHGGSGITSLPLSLPAMLPTSAGLPLHGPLPMAGAHGHMQQAAAGVQAGDPVSYLILQNKLLQQQLELQARQQVRMMHMQQQHQGMLNMQQQQQQQQQQDEQQSEEACSMSGSMQGGTQGLLAGAGAQQLASGMLLGLLQGSSGLAMQQRISQSGQLGRRASSISGQLQSSQLMYDLLQSGECPGCLVNIAALTVHCLLHA
jgi:hypothetical protein